MGDPCAGQLNAILFLATSLKAIEFSFEENLGLALLTRSKLM
jgi:hypothetical protein